MSTPETHVTLRMLHEYLGSLDGDRGQRRALLLLAEVLNGEYDIAALRAEVIAETND